ncbi:MAG: LacI family transcriptional regulator [Chloroflexota bacterium]|nr:LacI family transcriptional regulator [Chloroflexota bacterium]
MTQRVTIQDIARESHASPATVSLVLRDKPGISGETRKRVLATASALGYRPRGNGAEPPRSTRNIGLVLRARSRSIDRQLPEVNAFYSLVTAGIEAAARDERMNLLYATLPVDDNNQPLGLPDHLLRQRLDGVLLIGSLEAETISASAARAGSPVVLIDAPAGPHEFDAVVSDNAGGTFDAITYLVARGHRQIGLVSPDPRYDLNFAQRRAGYLRALSAHGLHDRWFPIPADGVAAGTVDLLRRHPDVTALVGCNDRATLDAMRAVQRAGYRVPEDISLIGFDDIDQAAGASPALTTMAVDKVSMGRLGVQTLSHRLTWPDSARIMTLLRTRLIERASVSARGG